MNYKQLLMLLVLMGFGTIATCQKPETQFEELIKEKYKTDEPGAAVLVAKNNDIIYRKAFGMADLELEVKMKPEMVFEIGSITKQFTAISILMLMEEDKLSLEDDITKYIEDYPTHGHTITIHHLLTHTSGIKSYTSMKEWQEKWRKDYEPKEFIDFFKYEPMNFAPGEEFSYNNSAYFLLGYIIEKVSGKTYPEFIEQNIFKPLEMNHSYYGSQKEIIENRAPGYQKKDEFVNAEYLSLTQPYSAGSIMSTVDDLYKWHKALHNHKLVEKETLEKAFDNYTLNNDEKINYGYGWFINEIKGSPTIEHGGGIFGYTTNAIYLPEENVYVAMLSNRSDFSPSTVSTRIAAHAIGKPYPGEKDRIKKEDEFLRSLEGVYDFDDGTTRYLTFEDGQLYSQRKGGGKIKIFPYDDKKLYFEESFAKYTIISKDGDDIKLFFKNRIEETKGHLTDRKIPEKKEVELSTELLKKYLGDYELQPNFIITITLEDGQLYAKATGQEKYKIFPKSDNRFFYKIVDAEIEFIKNDAGEVNALILYQGGREMRGEKK